MDLVTCERRNKLARTTPDSTLQELSTIFRRKGYLTIETVVDMGLLTFTLQVKLMENANFVFAVHGAAMSRIPFLRSSASVIEIHPLGHWIPELFTSLIEAISLNYTRLSLSMDRVLFLNCMKESIEKKLGIEKGMGIFISHQKMYRTATVDTEHWEAGAFLCRPCELDAVVVGKF